MVSKGCKPWYRRVQLGINHRQVDIPARAHEFLETVRADARLRLTAADVTTHDADAGARAVACFGAAARD